MYLTGNQRLAILLEGGIRGTYGKTELSLLRYSQAPIVAVIDSECAGLSLPGLTGIAREVPIVATVAAALAYAPEVLAIGIAPSGGVLPHESLQEVRQAVAAGLSIVNGLHTPIATLPEFELQPGQWIWDVRREPPNLPIASAKARSLLCRRVLTVGTDMGVGKMSTSLELNWAAKRRGLRSKFLATGQAGLMLEGDGVALDAVRVDFAAGAVEQIVMDFGNDYDILHIEGQGSLLHPGSTATLPLLRGSQPTQLVLVHRARQATIRNHPHVPIPPLGEVVRLYETVAGAVGALLPSSVVAIALNTAHLDNTDAQQEVEQTEAVTGLPCTDPVRFGAEVLLDAIMQK